MMEQASDQSRLFCSFNPAAANDARRSQLMLRMLIVGYCYGIRFERKLCEDVELHLAYRWFCRLDLDDKVPDHSTFSVPERKGPADDRQSA
jgi:transposase